MKPNSQSGQQDQPDQEARTSSDHQSASVSYGETHSGNVDYRIPGIPLSTVQLQDTNRRGTVKKLMEQFEDHPNKESFPQDLNKTEENRTFSENSKELIFELCETFSKKQCSDCALYWENGIVYCSCGRRLKPSQRTKQFDKKNHDAFINFPVTSSKRTSPMVPNRELPNGNECTSMPRRYCRKLANSSMVGTKPVCKNWVDCGADYSV